MIEKVNLKCLEKQLIFKKGVLSTEFLRQYLFVESIFCDIYYEYRTRMYSLRYEKF
jgi:hypothetical protein